MPASLDSPHTSIVQTPLLTYSKKTQWNNRNQKNVALVTRDGFVIRFNVDEVPLKKKSAVGVRGMKLTGTDEIEEVFFIANGENPVTTIKNKKYELNKVKLTKRDSKGTKVRG